MSNDADILYPSIVMAMMTLLLLLALGARRFIAVRRRAVNLRYYRTYDDGGGEPPALRRHSRHVQNHFEVPPLFHLAVWGTYAAGDVTAATIGAAWFFVATRVVHAAIHLGPNNVSQRFFVFGLGVLAVLYLWLQLLLSLLA
ncbi:MAG: hypothetical protein E6R07_10015 [Nevskiaceae bacterium]|nr:MAG: hypothetical protein E6R07_10015 [Nevskiaceae bacterium]